MDKATLDQMSVKVAINILPYHITS
jgi:DNA topoisomerase VI subunit B